MGPLELMLNAEAWGIFVVGIGRRIIYIIMIDPFISL
jgi:hypothetical protein